MVIGFGTSLRQLVIKYLTKSGFSHRALDSVIRNNFNLGQLSDASKVQAFPVFQNDRQPPLR